MSKTSSHKYQRLDYDLELELVVPDTKPELTLEQKIQLMNLKVDRLCRNLKKSKK